MMTPQLARVVDDVGPLTTAALVEYLRTAAVPADDWLTAIRRTLADVLTDAGPAPAGVNERLVALVTAWAASVRPRELSPVSYWLRTLTHPDGPLGETPAGQLYAALAAEVDAALAVAYLTPDVA